MILISFLYVLVPPSPTLRRFRLAASVLLFCLQYASLKKSICVNTTCRYLINVSQYLPTLCICIGFCIILRLLSLFLSWLEAREVLGAVWHMQASICRSLECTPHAGTHASATDADIQDDLEWTLLRLLLLNVVLFTVQLLLALDILVLAKLLQGAAGDEQSGAVGGGVVFVSDGNTVLSELGRGGLADNLVSTDGCVGNLTDDLGVREANDKPLHPQVYGDWLSPPNLVG